MAQVRAQAEILIPCRKGTDMPIGMIFWMLMILWFIFWGWTTWGPGATQFSWAPTILLFVLLFLLGWHDFGFVVK